MALDVSCNSRSWWLTIVVFFSIQNFLFCNPQFRVPARKTPEPSRNFLNSFTSIRPENRHFLSLGSIASIHGSWLDPLSGNCTYICIWSLFTHKSSRQTGAMVCFFSVRFLNRSSRPRRANICYTESSRVEMRTAWGKLERASVRHQGQRLSNSRARGDDRTTQPGGKNPNESLIQYSRRNFWRCSYFVGAELGFCSTFLTPLGQCTTGTPSLYRTSDTEFLPFCLFTFQWVTSVEMAQPRMIWNDKIGFPFQVLSISPADALRKEGNTLYRRPSQCSQPSAAECCCISLGRVIICRLTSQLDSQKIARFFEQATSRSVLFGHLGLTGRPAPLKGDLVKQSNLETPI